MAGRLWAFVVSAKVADPVVAGFLTLAARLAQVCLGIAPTAIFARRLVGQCVANLIEAVCAWRCPRLAAGGEV